MSSVILISFITSLLKCSIVVGVTMTFVALSVTAERRFSAWIQDRVGPNRVGIPLTNIRILGLGQAMADGLKFLLKEELTPEHVNRFYFTLAPVLSMVPALLTIVVVPFGSSIDLRWLAEGIGLAVDQIAQWLSFGSVWTEEMTAAFQMKAVISDLNVGVLFVLGIISISVYGVVIAGWASNSKYPFLGGIRASAQMISYELAMGLALVPVFLLVGQLNLGGIIQYQIENGWLAFPWTNLGLYGANGSFELFSKTFLLWIPLGIAFLIFLVAAFAETNRLPFDLAECETELVGGFHTEYSAMKFALFFLGEYAAMLVTSAIMVTLFFGGWSLPFSGFNGQGEDLAWWWGFIHIGVFILKMACFIGFFIFVRWTLPRFRYDQLMDLGWKFFIPVGLANVLLTAGILAYFYAK